MSLPRTSPLENLQTDWLSLVDALKFAEDGRREAEDHATRLLAENDILREQLTQANAERKLWQAYAVAVDAKLEICANVIDSARNDARIQARDKAQEPDPVERPNTAAQRIAAQEPPQAQQEPMRIMTGRLRPEEAPPRTIARPITPVPEPRDQDFEFHNGLPRTRLPQNQF